MLDEPQHHQPMSTTTDEIRSLISDGVSPQAIATAYGVPPETINRLKVKISDPTAKPKLTDVERAAILAEHGRGKTQAQIADQFFVNQSSISLILRAHGIHSKALKSRRADHQRICEQYSQGMPMYQIAREHGIDARSVSRILKAHGHTRHTWQKISPEIRSLILQCRKEGITATRCAELYQVSLSSVNRVMRDAKSQT